MEGHLPPKSKLAVVLDGRYLNSGDADFVQFVSSDIGYYLTAADGDGVLVFPPVDNYHRFLLHKTVEEDFPNLSSFSIGEGDERRTVVCPERIYLEAIQMEQHAGAVTNILSPKNTKKGRGRGRTYKDEPPVGRHTRDTQYEDWNEEPTWFSSMRRRDGRPRSAGHCRRPHGQQEQNWEELNSEPVGKTPVLSPRSSSSGRPGSTKDDRSGPSPCTAATTGYTRTRGRGRRPDAQIYVPRARRMQEADNEGHVTPVSGHGTQVVGHGPPNAGNVPSNAGHVSPNAGHVPSNAGHVPPNAGHVPSNIGHVPPGTGPMSPVLGRTYQASAQPPKPTRHRRYSNESHPPRQSSLQRKIQNVPMDSAKENFQERDGPFVQRNNDEGASIGMRRRESKERRRSKDEGDSIGMRRWESKERRRSKDEGDSIGVKRWESKERRRSKDEGESIVVRRRESKERWRSKDEGESIMRRRESKERWRSKDEGESIGMQRRESKERWRSKEEGEGIVVRRRESKERWRSKDEGEGIVVGRRESKERWRSKDEGESIGMQRRESKDRSTGAGQRKARQHSKSRRQPQHLQVSDGNSSPRDEATRSRKQKRLRSSERSKHKDKHKDHDKFKDREKGKEEQVKSTGEKNLEDQIYPKCSNVVSPIVEKQTDYSGNPNLLNSNIAAYDPKNITSQGNESNIIDQESKQVLNCGNLIGSGEEVLYCASSWEMAVCQAEHDRNSLEQSFSADLCFENHIHNDQCTSSPENSPVKLVNLSHNLSDSSREKHHLMETPANLEGGSQVMGGKSVDHATAVDNSDSVQEFPSQFDPSKNCGVSGDTIGDKNNSIVEVESINTDPALTRTNNVTPEQNTCCKADQKQQTSDIVTDDTSPCAIVNSSSDSVYVDLKIQNSELPESSVTDTLENEYLTSTIPVLNSENLQKIEPDIHVANHDPDTTSCEHDLNIMVNSCVVMEDELSDYDNVDSHAHDMEVNVCNDESVPVGDISEFINNSSHIDGKETQLEISDVCDNSPGVTDLNCRKDQSQDVDGTTKDNSIVTIPETLAAAETVENLGSKDVHENNESSWHNEDISSSSASSQGIPQETSVSPVEDDRSSNQSDTYDTGQVAMDTEAEEDSWDALFDEKGDALDPKVMEELTAAVGNVKVHKPQFDYYNYQPKDPDIDDTTFGHLIEIYNFPADLLTRDLIVAFKQFQDRGFDIKWVDDTHAIGVFSSTIAAHAALDLHHPLIKVRPISQASRATKMKAKKTAEFLTPYRPRPETTAAVARNLVTGALGLTSRIPREKRDEERKKLREAKEKKRNAAKQKHEAWEGFGKCAMDDT